MLKIIAIAVVVLVTGILLFAATRPDTFQVQRTTSIKAPPEKIFPLINNLQSFGAWNPFAKKDPGIKESYSGPASGKGAICVFDGNQDVGKGSLEITESSPPSRVVMQLRMTEPMQADNQIEFILEPKGDVTHVTWTMHGPVPYFAKIIHLVFNMDRMIGGDFETGLASLKSVAEK
jgi:uncharacterized protein YndB with AHSA1/START domain